MSEVVVDEKDGAHGGHTELTPFESERIAEDKMSKMAHVPHWDKWKEMKRTQKSE